MKPTSEAQKVISQLPVGQLWDGQRLVSTVEVRDLAASDIVELLRSGAVRFVVADVGKPFEWIPDSERFDFWKGEAKPHLADPDAKAALEEFPDEYCYFASEWQSHDGDTIILLSKAH